MLNIIGHYNLIFSLFFTLLFLLVLGNKNLFYFLNNKINNLLGIFCIIIYLNILISFFILIYSYLILDLSILNIKLHTHSNLQILYKITSVWGNHEGSMLLFVFIINFTNLLTFIFFNKLNKNLFIKILFFQYLILFFFIGFIIFTSNPFLYIIIINIDGLELNPILQDFALTIHPPLIYIGYVFTLIIYILNIVYYLTKNKEIIIINYIKIISLISWFFLTIGITLGSWWSYYELGWGGWWFWDPVENTALMPWIILTMLLHSINNNKYYINILTFILSLFSFLFSILGLFFVRSGILLSVHTFANDLLRGYYIFIFFFLLLLFSLFIIYKFKIFTLSIYKYSINNIYLSFNIIFLFIILIIILIGTILPPIYLHLFKYNITIGSSYYNLTLIPLILSMLFVLIIYILNNYKNYNYKYNNIYFIIGITIIFYIFIKFINILWLTYIGYILLLFIYIYILSFIFKLKYYIKNNKHYMLIGHFGFIIFLIGSIISNFGQYEIIKIMNPGEVINIRNINFIFRGINYSITDNYHSFFGNILIKISNSNFTTLFPEKRYYFIKEIYISKSNIKSNYLSDIYAMIGDGNILNGWYIRLYHSPLIVFIWIGSLLMLLSAILLIIYLYIIKPKKYINWL